ncbi:MAG TPA: hypothetical protein ENI13_00635, partial [candidate division CPR3 bacterium]|nr:hypothetical protein [candidate division CPR3 bacterium]
MSYQPLTQEQYQKAQQSGFDNEQILEMEKRRRKVLESVNSQEETQEEPQKRGFLEGLVKRPIERFVLEPGRRTTEALIATLPIIPKELRDGALDSSRQDLTFDLPFLGEFETKGLTEGGKQLAGESLETAAWLYTPVKAAGAIQTGLKEGIKSATRFGARVGGIGGGLFGAGEELQRGSDIGDVAKGAAVGVGLGAVGGAVIGGALPVVPAAVKGALGTGKTGFDLAESFSRSLFKTAIAPAKIVGETAKTTVGRVVKRTAEDVAETFSRRQEISQAPKHVAEAMKQGLE